MPAALKAHVVAELDKDLVKIPLADLPDHLGAVLAV
jgi:protein required for attachment to host cells